MEKTILLLQTEIMILCHVRNSMIETTQAMKGRISYESLHYLNQAIMSLEKDIISKDLEVTGMKII